MTLSTFDCIASITQHSAGFAAATRDHLDGAVEHCPGWTVADLVWHLTEVHWFWATIVEERLMTPPDESRRPPRPDDDGLVDVFKAGAVRLVEVLREADQSAACWTWAPAQQDVAFVTRHQVQEAAVHHWDAVHAGGGDLVIDDDVAVDSVEEFLTFSVPTEDHPSEPPRPSLDGVVVVCACLGDGPGARWNLTDAGTPGGVSFERDAEAIRENDPSVVVHTSAADFLLWLYRRSSELESGPVEHADSRGDVLDDDARRAVLARLRGLVHAE